ALRRAVRLNGFDSLAITKLDVLTGIPTIKLCVEYTLDGKVLNDVPALAAELARVEPRYMELPGWEEELSGITKWHQLPAATRLYLDSVAELLACPISMASVGADREATILSSSARFVKNFASARV